MTTQSKEIEWVSTAFTGLRAVTDSGTKRLHWSALPALSHKRSSPEPSGLKFTAVRTRVQSRLDSSSEPQELQHLAASTGGLLAIGYWLLAVGSQLIVFVSHGFKRMNTNFSHGVIFGSHEIHKKHKRVASLC